VLDKISCEFLESRLGTNKFGQLRPYALGLLAGGKVFFVFDYFLDLLVQSVDLCPINIKLGKTALVKNLNGSSILHRVLDIVDADVVTKRPTSIFVL
jgi:hypothetical protein